MNTLTAHMDMQATENTRPPGAPGGSKLEGSNHKQGKHGSGFNDASKPCFSPRSPVRLYWEASPAAETASPMNPAVKNVASLGAETQRGK